MTTESVKASVVRIGAAASTGFVACGTGFVMGGQGMVATCAHVLDDVRGKASGSKKILVQFDGEAPVGYSVLDEPDQDSDLALLMPDADRTRREPLRLADAVEPLLADGTEFDAYGHGYDTVARARRIRGTITNNDPLRSRYVLGAEIIPGDSGGPVVDRSGRVVAIVSAKHENYDGIGKAIPVRLLQGLIRRSRDANRLLDDIDEATRAKATLFKRLTNDLRALLSNPQAAYRAYVRLGLPPTGPPPETVDAILERVSVNPRIAVRFLANAAYEVDDAWRGPVLDVKARLAADYGIADEVVPPPGASGQSYLPALIGVVRNLQATSDGGDYRLYTWVGKPWMKLEPSADGGQGPSFGRGGLEAAAAEAIVSLLDEAERRGETRLSLEFALPIELVPEAVDRFAYGKRRRYVVGERHRVTIRLLDRLLENDYEYKVDWKERWGELSDGRVVLPHALVVGGAPPPTDLGQSLHNKHALVIMPGPATDDQHIALCNGLIDRATPLALWVRGGEGTDAPMRALVNQSLHSLLDTIDKLRRGQPCAVCPGLETASIAILLDSYEEDLPRELLETA